MKAILEFNLDEPDDRISHEAAVKGQSAHICLWDIDQYLRSKLKYSDLSEQEYKIYEEIRDELSEIMHNNKVSFLD